MKDKQEFHTRLLKKIAEADKTPEFAASKTGVSKLTRTLQLLGGTSPEVLVDVLGITEIPDDPWKAMNMVRNMDIATVRALEVFTTKGKGKQVGHHLTPGNILGKHLLGMSPQDRYDVFSGLIDMGRQHGMDPRQIIPLLDAVHGEVAHGGDWSGKKTGALLEVIPGEKGTDFLKRFQGALDIQDTMNRAAMADPRQTPYQAAFQGAAEGLDVPELDLGSAETDPNLRKLSTEILKPVSPDVRALVEANPDNPEAIRQGTADIVRQAEMTPAQTKKLNLLQAGAGQIKLNPKVMGVLFGATAPAIATIGMSARAAVQSDKEAKANPGDLRKQGIAALDKLGVAADTAEIGAMAAGPLGVPVMAVAGGVANLAGLGSTLLGLPDDIRRSEQRRATMFERGEQGLNQYRVDRNLRDQRRRTMNDPNNPFRN